MARATVSLVLAVLATSAYGLNTLVYGPGTEALRLLTAKLAAQAGYGASLYAGEEGKLQAQWRKLMYGAEYAEGGVDALGCARVLATVEDLGASLSGADALVIVCDNAPLQDGVASTLFGYSGEALKRLVLVSKMGVTRAKPAGPFGIGGADAALQANEKSVCELAASKGIEVSIVRVGTLKGGGPGEPDDESAGGYGLAKSYYDSMMDLTGFLCAQGYDKFTLGAKVQPKDPIDFANPIIRAGRGTSFDAFDDETSAIVAAGAVVHALGHPSAVELSVSAAEGKAPPTEAEWSQIFSGL